MRQALVERVQKILGDAGWVSCSYHGCFDIAAKKGNLMLIKVLSNIDALQAEGAKNLKIISANLSASMLLIGESTNRERLGKGIVYERFGLPAVRLETFERLIAEGMFPTIYRDRGGLYVRIDRELLREARNKRDLSQRELAEAVGINKKAIYEHERAQLRMTMAIAERLEAVLKSRITDRINLFAETAAPATSSPKDRLEAAVGRDLAALGFRTDFVGAAPFDLFARERVLLLTDIETNRKAMLRRAKPLKNFINTVQKPAVLITERARDEELLGIPVLERKELKELGTKELIKIAKRR